MASHKRVQIASPRPVPPYWRVVELSACENALNIRSSLSCGMPIPVSRTSKLKRDAVAGVSPRLTLTRIVPAGVNLMAFESRLDRIWRRRVLSPMTACGKSAANEASSRRPLRSIRG